MCQSGIISLASADMTTKFQLIHEHVFNIKEFKNALTLSQVQVQPWVAIHWQRLVHVVSLTDIISPQALESSYFIPSVLCVPLSHPCKFKFI